MVRIAYRTSSGIYGPKDATFPRALGDIESQLKRCRLREHSLKKCISVLLVVVAFCMCGLIVGLLSTCEEEDDLEEFKDTHNLTLKPVTENTRQGNEESTANTEDLTANENEFTINIVSTPTAVLPVSTFESIESSGTTTQESESRHTPTNAETTAVFVAFEDGSTNFIEVKSQEDASTEGVIPPWGSTSQPIISNKIRSTLTTPTVEATTTEATTIDVAGEKSIPTCIPVRSELNSTGSSFTPTQSLKSSSPAVIGIRSSVHSKNENDSSSTYVRSTLGNKTQIQYGLKSVSSSYGSILVPTNPPVATKSRVKPINKVSFVTTPRACCEDIEKHFPN